jgi:hypothetical protein
MTPVTAGNWWGRHRHDHRLCVGWLGHRAHDPKAGRRGGLGGSGGDLRRPIMKEPNHEGYHPS